MVLGWTRNTPRDFVFSAKLPQTITHKKGIDPARGIYADLKQFFNAMKPLREFNSSLHSANLAFEV
jgi:uncharacterized protein YecE (DUF72 family)